MNLLSLKRDQHGISSIIVIALGLVIVVIIVSNVFLWSYEMNRFDWEKMKEDVEVSSVSRVTNSPFFVAQSEYAVNLGRRVNGTYEDTWVAGDNRWEAFQEAQDGHNYYATTAGGNSRNVENVIGPPDDTYARLMASPPTYAYGGGFGTGTGDISHVYIIAQYHVSEPAIDDKLTLKYSLDRGATFGATSETIVPNSTVDFNWMLDVTADRTWTWSDISALSVWLEYKAIRQPDWRLVYVDALWVRIEYAYRLDINNTFVIDVSTYPLASIQTIEIQLRYRIANTNSETFYLKAYNWTAQAYSDNGFNSTLGNIPSTNWTYYAVNLTNAWYSYIRDDGAIRIKLYNIDGLDQTIINIDFLGVRAIGDWVRFTLENEGPISAHLVSLWIINSTIHQHYSISLFINPAEAITYLRTDISLPNDRYVVKVVTERGNIATYSSE